VAEWAEHHVAVDISAGPSRGATIVDWNDRGGGAANARIMRRFEAQAFERLLRMALGQGRAG
jgi:purine nucleosidase